MVPCPFNLRMALCSDYYRLDQNPCNIGRQSTRGSSKLFCDPGAENL